MRNNQKAGGHAGSAVAVPAAGSSTGEQLAWERKMWALNPDRFAAEFAAEMRTAVDFDRLSRLLAIWQERDPDGFIAWARKQPDSITLLLVGPNSGFSISHFLLTAAARKDPEYAWNLARRISPASHSTDSHRGDVIGLMLQRDPEAARAFVKKHRDEIAAFGQGNLGWYNRDPQKALPAAMELPPGPVRTSVIAELARYYGERADASAAAAEWFRSLPPEHQKEVSKLPAGNSFYRISDAHRRKLTEAWAVREGE